MRILILTTYSEWYENIRNNSDYELIEECPELDQVLFSFKKTPKDVFGIDDWRPFRRKLTDDSFIYVMPCIKREQVFLIPLKLRQDLVGSFVKSTFEDMRKKRLDVENSDIMLLAHDKDLFERGRMGEHLFDMNCDLDQESILKEEIEKLSLIYGYVHKRQPKDYRVFPIIEQELTKKTLNTDIIELIKQKLTAIESILRFGNDDTIEV